MKRFVVPLFALLAFLPTAASAQKASEAASWQWQTMWMRTTVAASTVAYPAPGWAVGSPGEPTTAAFLDSIAFRKGVATRTIVDTTAAYPMAMFSYPPTMAMHGAASYSRAQKLLGMQALPGGTDSVVVDTTDFTPWIAVRVRQDSLDYGTGTTPPVMTSGLDSVFVGAQISYDGYNGLSVSGTPTRAYIANPTGVSGEDGIAVPSLAATEVSPGADAVEIRCECFPWLVRDSGTAFIINRTLCDARAKFIRFIIGVNDGQGQFAAEVGHW